MPQAIHPSTLEARAEVFLGAHRDFETRSLRIPSELAPGECLVELSLATICGSDLHTVDGRRSQPVPCILGHEGVGRVVRAGPGRDVSLVGRRVSWTLIDHCGACVPCRDWGLPQKCEHLFKYGHAPISDGAGLNGCYATHILLRAGTAVFPVPDNVTDAMAAPANCALATMAAVAETLGKGGRIAVIQGAGLLGLLGCALLRRHGWQKVYLVDTLPHRLELAAQCGGLPVPAADVSRLGDGIADAVIEATGRPEVIADGLRLLHPGGRYEWVGMVHPDSAVTLLGETLVRKCLTLHGTHNYAPRHLAQALEFLSSCGLQLPWDRLVSTPEPLDHINSAIRLARAGAWPRISLRP